MFRPLPVSPTPTGAISRRYSVRGVHRVTRFQARKFPERPVSSPCTTIRTIATHCPPPLEGAGGGRGSGREAGVFPEVKPVSRWHASDRGRGVPPPPRQPHPHGAILHGYTARERSSLCRQCEHPAEIQFLSPGAVSGAIAKHSPAPIEGAGGGRGSGRAVGVDPEVKTPPQEMPRQGKGRSAPSPSAPPRGGDSPWIQCHGEKILSLPST